MSHANPPPTVRGSYASSARVGFFACGRFSHGLAIASTLACRSETVVAAAAAAVVGAEAAVVRAAVRTCAPVAADKQSLAASVATLLLTLPALVGS
jgi:hypothetical protein